MDSNSIRLLSICSLKTPNNIHILFILFSLISHLSFSLFLSLTPFPLFLPLLYHTFSNTTWRWALCTILELMPDRSPHFLYHTFLDTNLAETIGTVSAVSMWKSPVSSLWCKVQKPDVDFGPSSPLSPCRSPVLGATQANLSLHGVLWVLIGFV